MKSLGEALKAAHPEITPIVSPEYLRGLKPTADYELQLGQVEKILEDHRATGIAPRKIEQTANQLRRKLDMARERDRLQAERPAGCWCLGAGGKGERAMVRPDAVATEVQVGERKDWWFGMGDYVTFLDEYCVCPEAAARRERDDALRAELRQLAEHLVQTREVERLWKGAQIPERFNGLTLATYPATAETQVALRAAERFLDHPRYWCLTLSGGYGVGKTGMGIGIVRQGAERQIAGLFVKAPELLRQIKATYSKNSDTSEDEVLRSLQTVRLLVLDDLGAEHGSDAWVKSLLFQVLDYRHDALLKTVVTTNLDLNGLAKHLGDRNWARYREDTKFVTVSGPNLRERKDAAA